MEVPKGQKGKRTSRVRGFLITITSAFLDYLYYFNL